MKKKDLTKFARKVQEWTGHYSPEILMGVGIAGMITTTVLAVKATPKALESIEVEKEKQEVEELSPVDTIKVTYKYYIPAMVLGATSVGCLIGSHSVSARRTAAIATAYKISETALTEYKDKVVEVIGEEKEHEIKKAVAVDKMNDTPIVDNQVVITEKGNTLCFDVFSGRYFRSDADFLIRAQNEVNREMINNSYVSLNEFYVAVGLDPIAIGNQMGWNTDDRLLELDFSTQLVDDRIPCLVMDFNINPKYSYDRFL